MSESSFRRSLTKGVGRRILAMFLLAALLPTIFTAVLAFSEFNRGLETEAAKALRHSAKEYGVEILTRLDLAIILRIFATAHVSVNYDSNTRRIQPVALAQPR